MSTVIAVENLGKKYLLNHQSRQGGYVALRDVITDCAKNLGQRLLGPRPQRPDLEEFWALKQASFNVQQGDRIGIIGRNGAGKSTLLKILSRITEPSTGSVRITGRVASLLEVGTGFHPELTGRENIFLNGAILGMSRSEIRSKFDEIVDFAEVERFLDTPVKRFSSGMYMRLAFAVAAHLEPEILIVDEVLAVGDVQFQKKCLEKMDKIGREGRTVLFVSHNTQAIRQFCTRAILLADGAVIEDGAADDVVDLYVKPTSSVSLANDLQQMVEQLPPDPVFRLLSVRLLQGGGDVTEVANGEPVRIKVEYEVFKECFGLHVYLQLFDPHGNMLVESFDNGEMDELPRTLPGRYVSHVDIPADFLAPRPYELLLLAAIHNVRTCIPPVRIPLRVMATGRVNRAYPGHHSEALLLPLFPWFTETLPTASGIE